MATGIYNPQGRQTYGQPRQQGSYGGSDAWGNTKTPQPSSGDYWSGPAFGGSMRNRTNAQPTNFATTNTPQTNAPQSNQTNVDWYNNWQNVNNSPTFPSTQTGQQTINNRPGMPASQGTGQGQGFTWSPPSWVMGQNQAGWATPEMTQALQNYGQILPYVQLQQNSYQYTNDFNENQRRWDNQFGWQQNTDQFNMNLAAQQQQMADWVARNQQRNWETQFGLDQEMGRGYLNLAGDTLRSEDAYRQGQLGVARDQNRIDEMYKRGQLSNEQYANESQRIYQTGQLAQAANELRSEDWYRRAQANIAQSANTIDQMWKSGQLSNQQREIALAELTQAQTNTFRNAQLAQEAALAREQMANQVRIANMQAFGRAQTPNARFVRSW
jgi:hypothetical protein